MNKDDLDAIKEKSEKLSEAIQKVGTQMYEDSKDEAGDKNQESETDPSSPDSQETNPNSSDSQEKEIRERIIK